MVLGGRLPLLRIELGSCLIHSSRTNALLSKNNSYGPFPLGVFLKGQISAYPDGNSKQRSENGMSLCMILFTKAS